MTIFQLWITLIDIFELMIPYRMEYNQKYLQWTIIKVIREIQNYEQFSIQGWTRNVNTVNVIIRPHESHLLILFILYISNHRSIYLRQLLLTACLICVHTMCKSIVKKRRHAKCGVPQEQRNKRQLLQTLTSVKTSY